MKIYIHKTWSCEAVKEALEERINPEVPSDFLIKLLELILKYNIFEFNSDLYLQLIGTAMGTKPAPSYANIFMARRIDNMIKELAAKFGDGVYPIRFLKRFLDDIFMIFTGSIENLHLFLDELNTVHPTIKFTMNHTFPNNPPSVENPAPPCQCPPTQMLAFLDTACSIISSQITTDLYKKPTDRNQYLMTSSCHPAHVTNNIPFSLALRIVRICSNESNRDIRLDELNQLLLSRNYKPGIIRTAIERAKSIPRVEALNRVEKSAVTRRPVFVLHYDPRLPSVTGIVKKHWRTMVSTDPHLKEVFPLPPLVAYKRPPNIKEKLIRAKVPPLAPDRPIRKIPGMKKCTKCPICPFVQPGKSVKSTSNNTIIDINTSVNCQSQNIIYCISCQNCRMQYIGESERSLQHRFSEHKGYATNKHLTKATGAHFNLPGHSVSDMKVTILEKVHSMDPLVRKEREELFIRKFNSKYKGMNNR